MDAVSMMTPRSSSSGSLVDMCQACRRLRLNVPMRFSSIDAAEVLNRVRPLLGQGPLPDAAAGGVHRDVQAAQCGHGVGHGRLDLVVVEDVHLVERAVELLGHLGPGRVRQVEDGDVGALLAQQLGRGLGHPRRAADDDGLLPLDLHGGSSLVCSRVSSAAVVCDAVWPAGPAATRERRVYYFGPEVEPPAAQEGETMERETILFDVADNVATITLNRPDSLNSFNEAMAIDMTWAWETVRDTDDIHCAVLQANGDRAFCTGIDVKAGGNWFMKDNVWNSFDPGMAPGAEVPSQGLEAGGDGRARAVPPAGPSTSSTSPTSSSAPTTRCSSTRTPTSAS